MYLSKLIKKDVSNEIYIIFPKIKKRKRKDIINEYQSVIFNIYNSDFNKLMFTICHGAHSTYLIDDYIVTRNIYIFPLINNNYIHFMYQRSLYISYIFTPEQWYTSNDSYSCSLNSMYINEFLQSIYNKLHLNIPMFQFLSEIDKLIQFIRANELLLNI